MLSGKGTLTPIQKNLLIEFGKISDAAFFYLTGGTALAEFYLKHRRSYDLDFFTGETGLVVPFTRVLEEQLLHNQYSVNAIRRFETFVEFEVNKAGEAVRLHFAYDSPFRFEKPLLSEFGVKVNDYQDLIVDKLLTFFGRWEYRDAIDLFFILKQEPIDILMEQAKQKDPGFDPYWFSIALKEIDKLPDEIGRWPVEMLAAVDVRELKSNFLSLAHEIMDKLKGEK